MKLCAWEVKMLWNCLHWRWRLYETVCMRDADGMKLCEWEVMFSEQTVPMLTDRGGKRNNSVILRDLIGRPTVQFKLNFCRCRALCFTRYPYWPSRHSFSKRPWDESNFSCEIISRWGSNRFLHRMDTLRTTTVRRFICDTLRPQRVVLDVSLRPLNLGECSGNGSHPYRVSNLGT